MIKTRNGNTIECLINETYNGVLVIGAVHGDEPQGYKLIKDYLRCITSSKLAFIPALNPDGLAHNQRCNANGVDLNRNFPTQNWILGEKNEYFGGTSPASEIETQILIKAIQLLQPKLIITLHAPYKVVNYDGPAEIYAKKISEIIKYPVEPSIGYPTPGSFGTWAGIENNIPTITLELDEEIDIEQLKQPVFKIFEYLEGINFYG